MALSPAALAGMYHALMGMPAEPLSAAALSTEPTLESLQQQAMVQQMAIQAGVPALPTPAQLQMTALQMNLTGALQVQAEQMLGVPSSGGLLDDRQRIPGDYQVLGEFAGQIHAYDDKKGFGFVTCIDLQNNGHRKDPFLLRSQLNGCKLGDHINFKAVVNEKGQLQAWELKYIRDGVPEEKNQKSQKKAYDNTPSCSATELDMGQFEGTISGAHDNGTLYIYCQPLRTVGWEFDVLLEKDQNPGYDFGDTVNFQCTELGGRLKAKAVTLVKSSYMGSFSGTVQSYDIMTGTGLIMSEMALAQGISNICYNKKETGGGDFNMGDQLTFQCFLNSQGNPQARNLEMVQAAPKRDAVEADLIDWDTAKAQGKAARLYMPAIIAQEIKEEAKAKAVPEWSGGGKKPPWNPNWQEQKWHEIANATEDDKEKWASSGWNSAPDW